MGVTQRGGKRKHYKQSISGNLQKTMGHFISFALLLFSTTIILGATVTNNFYCKTDPSTHPIYSICRKCPDLKNDCETSTRCQCDNIQIRSKPGSEGVLIGGSDCQSMAGSKKYCYVSSTSPCEDKVVSGLAATYEKLWFKNDISVSFDACSPDNIQNNNTGNEAILEGVKITSDTEDEDLIFDFDSSDDCKEECLSRKGDCGSWSFDNSARICYLHTVDSCCGQFGKRKSFPGFTSGYTCKYCWSTKPKTDCPCSIEHNHGTAFSSGADSHCIGEIELDPNFKNGDQRKPRKKIVRYKGRYVGHTRTWTIKRNAKMENLKTKKATLTDGNCCWTITGTQSQEIKLRPQDPPTQVDFYVKKVKSHQCEPRS